MEKYIKLLPVALLALAIFVIGCGPKQTQPPAAQTPPAAKPEGQAEVAAANLPKMWDFWATWCPPCKEMKPIVEALEKEYEGRIEIRSIDTDQNKELASKFKIEAIPTLVFLDAKGNELGRIVGKTERDTILGRFKGYGFTQ